jgi:predicted nuclease of predicted toxin-antitoxin system
VKFLVDAQLPPLLAAWLRDKGHEAVHVEDAGLRNSDDIDVRNYAEVNGMIVVTKDRDFVATPLIGTPPPVLWVRTGNAPTRVIVERFESNWTAVAAYLAQGFAVVELR